MSYILAPNKENVYAIAYAHTHTRFAYAHILSYMELTLAYAHQSFSYAAPLQGAPSWTWIQYKGLERGSINYRDIMIYLLINLFFCHSSPCI